MSALSWLTSGKKSADNSLIGESNATDQVQTMLDEILPKRAALLESKAPIDVRTLMELYTVEELCETAEDYYRNVEDTSGLLAKPYICMSETPELLGVFSQLLLGIKPVGGMDILDFGAGPGWASHALTSLGAKMIVSDVSMSGLKIAADRFKRIPVPSPHVPPKFLHFNGRTFDLPNESVDRIICIDAFHHIPNPVEVLGEMSRVLRQGGVAAFAEPGPKHSWSPGAQYEMRHHQVVENDVVIEDIWAMAKQVGFSDIRLAVFCTSPFHVSMNEFNEFLAGGKSSSQYLNTSQHYMQNSRRLFFLSKGAEGIADSRSTEGLQASIKIKESGGPKVRLGDTRSITAKVTNTGKVRWLPPSHGLGSVWLGAHLHEKGSSSTKTGFFTTPLPTEEAKGLMPGKSVEFTFELTVPDKTGDFDYEFDLVSQQVAWFHSVGSPTTRMSLSVCGANHGCH